MHPSDNSVIRTIKCDLGDKTIGSSIVIKDNFTFGIRESSNSSNQADCYKDRDEIDSNRQGCDFWCTLGDPSVKLFVEYELDEREGCAGASATMTFQEGLIVKFLGSMEVVQSHSNILREQRHKVADLINENYSDSEIEMRRIITKQGTVIRQMKNGDRQLLFANGNFSIYNAQENTWTKTKNSGERVVHKVDSESGKITSAETIEPLIVNESIDPETNTNVIIRSDGVIIIYYNDGSTLTLHNDSTQILKVVEQNITDIIVEKDTFCPVKIRYNAVKFRAQNIIGLGGTNALMGIDDIMERTYDGYVIETHLPDKTTVESFREKQQLEGYNNFSDNVIHIIRRHDFSAIKVKQDGEVVVITSNERAMLNDIGYQHQLGKDKDYFFEFFGLDSDRRSGVYTIDVKQGFLKTTDGESNNFVVYPNGESIERLSVSFNLDETADSLSRKKPNSPRNLPDGEFVEEECKFLVPPKSILEPRLFFIKNDESGVEF